STQPSPGTEAALRGYIASIERGKPNYGLLTPELARALRDLPPIALASVRKMGALKSLAFRDVDPIDGWDHYTATYENGEDEWRIAPLLPDGKVPGLDYPLRARLAILKSYRGRSR